MGTPELSEGLFFRVSVDTDRCGDVRCMVSIRRRTWLGSRQVVEPQYGWVTDLRETAESVTSRLMWQAKAMLDHQGYREAVAKRLSGDYPPKRLT